MVPAAERVCADAMRLGFREFGLDRSEFSPTLSAMTRLRRRTSTRAVALLAAVLTLLGVQLFLPAAAVACGPAMSDCCCAGEASGDPASAEGCDCSISQPAPAPAAEVASGVAFAPPLIPTETVDDFWAAKPAIALPPPVPPSRSRAAPTQALLETFRN